MKEFDELLEVARRLNGEGGCPWDIKQTFFSLQPYVIEEAHEVVEAVDKGDDKEIIEELGDLLYTVIFYAKIAERENKFSMSDIILSVKEKLIRRHPHVFGTVEAASVEDVVKNWDAIKRKEEGKEKRKTPLDGIPLQLPLLTKAQKIIKIFLKERFVKIEDTPKKEESEIADAFFDLVKLATISGIDLEGAVRRKVQEEEKRFLQNL